MKRKGSRNAYDSNRRIRDLKAERCEKDVQREEVEWFWVKPGDDEGGDE